MELGRSRPGWEGRRGADESEKALTVRVGRPIVGPTGADPALASGAQWESEGISAALGSGEISQACTLRASGQRACPGAGPALALCPALREPRPARWVSESYQVGNLPAFQKFPSGWDWLYRPH